MNINVEIPDEASGRDKLLYLIHHAWPICFNKPNERVETILDNDMGAHILALGTWELELRNIELFPR